MQNNDNVKVTMRIATTKSPNKNCRKYAFTQISEDEKTNILHDMKIISVNHCIREDEGKEYKNEI